MNPLFSELDGFIRKYYKNQLLKGCLITLCGLGALFLAFNGLEHFLYLSSKMRLCLLLAFVIVTVLAIILGVIRPILKIFRIGKQMDYQTAEPIIRRYFPQIQDKLLNLLELYKKSQDDAHSEYLILQAAIAQKTDKLSVYKFVRAISYKTNWKYARMAIIPTLIIVGLVIFYPTGIVNPSKRILSYKVYFEKPSPFAFEILNEHLETDQNTDFELIVKSVGDEIPNELLLVVGNNVFKMTKQNKVSFAYKFINVHSDIEFIFQVGDIQTKPYHLSVIPKPVVYDMKIMLHYPQYTGLRDETIETNGNLSVPEGTNIRWQVLTKDVDTLFFGIGQAIQSSTQVHAHKMTTRATQSTAYWIAPKNRRTHVADTMYYALEVVQDVYPSIEILEFRDSLNPMVLFFKGQISDDYGFSNVQMRILKNNATQDTLTFDVSFDPQNTRQEILHFIDVSRIMNEFGDKITYYFEVSDNDGVNGYKTSYSQTFAYITKTEQEVAQELTQQAENLIHSMEDNLKKLKTNEKELERLARTMLEKPTLGWEERKEMQKILQEMNAIQQQHKNAKEQMELMFRNEQQLNKDNQRLLEKQQLMQTLYDQVMTEEMKKTLEEIESLMQQQYNKNQLEQALEQIRMNNEDMEKQLDQNIAIFKQMEVERKREEAMDQLDALTQKQRELREEMQKSEQITENQKQQQENINKEFENLQQQLDAIEKDNQQLENPLEFNRSEKNEQQAEQALQKAQQQMQSNDKQQAEQSQQQAEDAMQAMLDEMEQSEEEESNGEDAEMIRHVLKNIVQTSKGQEALMEQMKTMTTNDPRYTALMRQQASLKGDITTISDSLYALGRRQPIVATTINKTLKEVERNSESVMQQLLGANDIFHQQISYRNQQATRQQQQIMTGLNDMGLLLAESLKKMQEQQQMKGQGSGRRNSKNKNSSGGRDGQKKSKAQSAREMQEALNKRLQEMRQAMQKEGGNRPQSGEKGQPKMSEQFARAAAQQEAIRRLMQETAEQMKRAGGKATGEMQNLISEMERIERELVNKTLNDDMLRRQNQIVTRLLEAEKAEMNREQEERRQSQEAQQKTYNIPKELLDKKIKNHQIFFAFSILNLVLRAISVDNQRVTNSRRILSHWLSFNLAPKTPITSEAIAVPKSPDCFNVMPLNSPYKNPAA